MYYQLYELNHAFLSPARAVNDAMRLYYKNPLNPMSHTELGRQMAAAGDVFERLTRRYGKPEFNLRETEVNGHKVAVTEELAWERPFCRLVHFRRALPEGTPRQPNLVIVAPMSGHYATLLRGTVAAMLPFHEVFITDWADARMVPLAMGRFDLDDYIDYVTDMVRHFGGDCHMVAVCQPAVPVFAATALMEADGGIHPKSITLMGGPVDTRENPTEVNTYAAKHDIDWFHRNVIQPVPFPHPGMMRRVYPGFLQLTGFMTMNLDRHMTAHYDYFDHLVKGDGDSAEKHREFYDEYLSVMDLTAEFYLQTVETVFLRQALPRGIMRHRNRRVDPGQIRSTPILTVEGEKDDISGLGQTRAAHKLTPNLRAEMHGHYEQAGVGHYGVFNGSRFRREIAPRIADWVLRWDGVAPFVQPQPAGARFDAAAMAQTAAATATAALSATAAIEVALAGATARALAAAAPPAQASAGEGEESGPAALPPLDAVEAGGETPALPSLEAADAEAAAPPALGAAETGAEPSPGPALATIEAGGEPVLVPALETVEPEPAAASSAGGASAHVGTTAGPAAVDAGEDGSLAADDAGASAEAAVTPGATDADGEDGSGDRTPPAGTLHAGAVPAPAPDRKRKMSFRRR